MNPQWPGVLGHPEATARLDDLLQQQHMPHALVLRGPKGCGKLALARALAARLLAQGLDGPAAAKTQDQALRLQHPDQHWLLPLAAKAGTGTDDYLPALRDQLAANPYLSLQEWGQSLEAENRQLNIAIAEVRALQRKLLLRPLQANCRVVLVWQADRMNTEAANAFLKLLEEPPNDTYILLTQDSETDLLPTIASRCQSLVLHRLTDADVAQGLQELFGVPAQRAAELAGLSEGNLAAALQLYHLADDNLGESFKQWMRLCYEGKLEPLQQFVEHQARQNREGQKLLLQFALHKLRHTGLTQWGAAHLAPETESETQFTQRFAQALKGAPLEAMVQLLEDRLFHLGRNANAQMLWLTLSLELQQLMRQRPSAG